jgi:hypothetical protein
VNEKAAAVDLEEPVEGGLKIGPDAGPHQRSKHEAAGAFANHPGNLVDRQRLRPVGGQHFVGAFSQVELLIDDRPVQVENDERPHGSVEAYQAGSPPGRLA